MGILEEIEYIEERKAEIIKELKRLKKKKR